MPSAASSLLAVLLLTTTTAAAAAGRTQNTTIARRPLNIAPWMQQDDSLDQDFADYFARYLKQRESRLKQERKDCDRSCKNGGFCDYRTLKCRCPLGAAGKYCEKWYLENPYVLLLKLYLRKGASLPPTMVTRVPAPSWQYWLQYGTIMIILVPSLMVMSLGVLAGVVAACEKVASTIRSRNAGPPNPGEYSSIA